MPQTIVQPTLDTLCGRLLKMTEVISIPNLLSKKKAKSHIKQ